MNYYCKINGDAESAVFALALKGGIIEGNIPFGMYNVAYIDETDGVIKYANMNQFAEYVLAHSNEWEDVQPLEVTTHTLKVFQLPDDFDKYQIPDEVKMVAGFLGHNPDKKYDIRLIDYSI